MLFVLKCGRRKQLSVRGFDPHQKPGVSILLQADIAPMAKWIRQPPPKRKIVGSSPTRSIYLLWLFELKVFHLNIIFINFRVISKEPIYESFKPRHHKLVNMIFSKVVIIIWSITTFRFTFFLTTTLSYLTCVSSSRFSKITISTHITKSAPKSLFHPPTNARVRI
jgi:hypothetical protein